MSKNNISELKEQIKNLYTEYNLIQNEVNEIKKNPLIIRFEELKEDLSFMYDKIEQLEDDYSKLYQSECSHPIWVLIEDQTDSYEQRQILLCKCIRCQKEKKAHSRNFDEIINTKEVSYYDLYKNYHNLSNKSEDEAIQLVKKIANNK